MMWYTTIYGDFMIKKFLITLSLLCPLAVFANFSDILVVDVQYDWIDKSEVEKEAIISDNFHLISENSSPLEWAKYICEKSNRIEYDALHEKRCLHFDIETEVTYLTKVYNDLCK